MTQTTQPATFPPPPGAKFPYQIEAQIGRGGMGVVYRAVEPALERKVAIKFLRTNLLEGGVAYAKQVRARFLQEARAAAALSHPGVTTIFRVGEVDGYPYIAMEWLQGRILDDFMGKPEQLSIAWISKLGVELLEALDAAHLQGIVHRDVKPANIMILADGRTKIMDFGVARVSDSELVKTQAGAVLGTPRYASPEQFHAEELDGRSDIFAVGILLYELICGVPPFHGATFVELVTAVIEAEPEPPSKHTRGVPALLDEIILRALRKKPEHRYPRALAMAAELRTLLGTPAPPPTIGMPSISSTTTTQGEATTGLPLVDEPPPSNNQDLAALIDQWSGRNLGSTETQPVIEQLSERPLLSPAFSGAAVFDDVYLLFERAYVVGALCLSSGKSGDAAVDQVPVRAEVRIHPAPNERSVCRISAVLDRGEELHPLLLTHQNVLRDYPLTVGPRGVEADPSEKPELKKLRSLNPMSSLLDWILHQLPELMAERGKSKSWKYLVGWIPNIQKVMLHQQLQRGGESYVFDLVTYGADGRILHLAQRLSTGSRQELEAFLDQALSLKKSLIKSGDVGGVIAYAPSFDQQAMEAYKLATTYRGKLRESVTGYEGFVRIGKTRGFHLLLVVDTPAGPSPILNP